MGVRAWPNVNGLYYPEHLGLPEISTVGNIYQGSGLVYILNIIVISSLTLDVRLLMNLCARAIGE